MSAPSRPTLTDAKGMGGLNAQDGFDYQVWDALVRLPAWLRNPAFEGFGVELLEDAEVRFFAPHAPQGHLIDRFQAKTATLSRGELIEVFESFQGFDRSYPGIARVQVLVTPALPKGQAYLARDPGRVRRARPFYAPFADVHAASEAKLRTDIVDDLGQEVGDFFADSVEIALVTLPDKAAAQAAFAAALNAFFPDLDLGARAAGAAFQALYDLASAERGRMIARDEILATFKASLGHDLVVDGALPLHVRSDRNGAEVEAIEIDGRGFSGTDMPFPDAQGWRARLLEPLDRAQRWARARNRQRIALSGSYRLTTAFALGWSFRSAVGFEIDIPTRDGVWPTDDRPARGDPAPPWQIEDPVRLLGDRLVVCVGVIRDPRADVLHGLSGCLPGAMLSALHAAPLTSARDAQASAQTVKTAVDRAAAALRPVQIDLYVVGPSAFAVALGHRWNGLPPTQLHEFLPAERRYTPTALIG